MLHLTRIHSTDDELLEIYLLFLFKSWGEPSTSSGACQIDPDRKPPTLWLLNKPGWHITTAQVLLGMLFMQLGCWSFAVSLRSEQVSMLNWFGHHVCHCLPTSIIECIAPAPVTLVWRFVSSYIHMCDNHSVKMSEHPLFHFAMTIFYFAISTLLNLVWMIQ